MTRFVLVAMLGLTGLSRADEPVPSRLQEPPTAVEQPQPVVEASVPRVRPSGGPAFGGGPLGGGQPGYDVTWYPAQRVGDQPTNMSILRQNLSVGAPIWKRDGDILLANFRLRNAWFDTNAILPDTKQPFPDQLWNVSFGLNYLHKYDNGWSSLLITSIGSASDKPFHSLHEMTANLGGILMIPARNGRDMWQIGAIYTAGGAVNFPIPILGYAWKPSEQFRMNIGLPITLFWQPTEALTLDLSYAPLLTINARMTYQFAPKIKLYGGYEYLNESYYLAGRENNADRFFGLEQRLISGVRYDWHKYATLELNTGHAFGRRYGSGNNQFSSLTDRVEIASGAFVGLRVAIQY